MSNDTEPTVEQRRAAARTAAAKRLREKHPEDWDAMLGEEMTKQGVEWTPRLTPEQKAQQQIESLLAQFPALRPAAVGTES